MKIWNLIGRQLCEAFTLAGNPMQFQLATKEPLFDKKNSTHYIFVVDVVCLTTLIGDFIVAFTKFKEELSNKISKEEEDFKIS